MNFNNHTDLKGKHSMLAPSQPQWLRYSDEQLFQKYAAQYAQSIGTLLHELAETLIKNNLKLKKSDKLVVLTKLLENGIPRNVIDIERIYYNFMNYVNEAIGYRLTPEQILYYSDYCYGTADAISFRNNFLRIHDYKSGITKPKMEQLLTYAALFCLEYRIKPGEIDIELCIYWHDAEAGEDTVLKHNPQADEILPIMDTIIHHSKALERMNKEV